MELTRRRLRGVLDGREIDLVCLIEEGALPGAGRIEAALEAAIDEARRAGCALALLIAAADAGRFEKTGFALLPASEAACMSRMPAPWPGEPAWVEAGDPFRAVPGLRPARLGDLEAIAAIHEVMIREQRLRIVRDRSAWESIVGSLDSDPSRHPPDDGSVWVIESGGGVTAYLVMKESPGLLRWREHGTMPGAADLAAVLFWSALAWSRRRALRRVEGWFLPPEVTRRPLYPVARRPRASPALLLRPLDPTLSALSLKREEDCRIWELDLS